MHLLCAVTYILYIGLLFFNFIPDIWKNIVPIIAIVSFVLYSMAIYSVGKAAASKSLFNNAFFSSISFLLLFSSDSPGIVDCWVEGKLTLCFVSNLYKDSSCLIVEALFFVW